MDWRAPIRWATNLLSVARGTTIEPNRTWVSRPAGSTRITEDSALTLPAVYSAVSHIAGDLAGLPWNHFERGENSRRRLVQSDVDWLLHTQPNPDTTAFVWRQALVAHVLLWGNGYAQIERDFRGRPAWLWLLPPDTVTPAIDPDGSLVYRVWTADGWITYGSSDIFHARGLGFDGRMGYSRVRMAARTLGIVLQQDEMADSFYGNQATIGGAIKVPAGQRLTVEARDVLLESFNARHRGTSKAGEWNVLDAGMDIVQFKMPMTDAQFLESRQFSTREVAQWFQIPPHKLADMDRATWGNVEQQEIEYVTSCLMPIAQMLEAEANAKLLGRNQRSGQYTKIDLRGLMRGDQGQRNAAYAVARQWGWMNANEIRALEDFDSIGAEGDVYLVPANMTTIERIENPPEQLTQPRAPARIEEEEEEPASARMMRGLVSLAEALRPEVTVHPPSVAIGEQHVTVTVPERKADIHVMPPAQNILVEGATVHSSPVSLTIPEREVNISPAVTNVAAPTIHIEPVNVIVPEREVLVQNNVSVPEREVRIEPAAVNVSVPEREVRIENRVDPAAPIVNVINEQRQPEEQQMSFTTFMHDDEGRTIGMLERRFPQSKRRKRKDTDGR